MPIKFSDHAKSQLKKRGISQKLAIETVENPDETEDSFKARKLRRKSINDKILEVVTKTEGNKITIVTGYYLKGKYEN